MSTNQPAINTINVEFIPGNSDKASNSEQGPNEMSTLTSNSPVLHAISNQSHTKISVIMKFPQYLF
jgi:hypothetical protein